METELAAAEANMHVFMGSVMSQATPEQPPSSLKQPQPPEAQRPSTSKQLKSENVTPLRQFQATGTSTVYKIPVTSQKHPQSLQQSYIPHQTIPCKAKAEKKPLGYEQKDEHGSSISTKGNLINEGFLTGVLKRQNEITELLVKQHQAAFLPAREIPAFDGDALQL